MKILQINQYYGYGSTGVIVSDLQQLCLNHGIDCYVAYASIASNCKNVDKSYKIGNKLSYKVHALLARFFGKEAYYSTLSTLRFIRYIEKLCPDIIHIHNLHDHYLNYPLLFKYIANKKIRTILTMHDCWVVTGGCFHFEEVKCNKWISGCKKCPKRYHDTPAYLHDSSSTIYKDRKVLFSAIQDLTLVCVSEWLERVVKMSQLKNINTQVIHNGVDTEFFRPVCSDLRDKLGINDKFVILAPANKWMQAVNRDNVQRLLCGIDDDMVVVFFGYGCDNLIGNEKIINYGFVKNRDELVQLYSISDVFINSTREDSLPFANLEPQACGTPVITFANTGTTETIGEGSGYCVDNDDMDMMLHYVFEIKKRGKEFYSQKCITWIKNNFNKQDNYLDYIKLYER